MSDLHIEICETIESTMCEELCMEKCERTYEVATDIFKAIVDKIDGATLVLPEQLVEKYGR